MISDLDNRAAANILICQHGSDAELETAERVDLMKGAISTGNLSGADQAGNRRVAGSPEPAGRWSRRRTAMAVMVSVMNASVPPT
jgi:hypothetical protein